MPLGNAWDQAVFLLSNFGQQIRPDVGMPTFKMLFEWDLESGEAALRQPDSKNTIAGRWRAPRTSITTCA